MAPRLRRSGLATLIVVLASCAKAPLPAPTEAGLSTGRYVAAAAARAADYRSLDERLAADVQPVLRTYCYGCHGGAAPASMLDLTSYDNTAKVVAAFGVWDHVRSRLDRQEM